MPTPGQVAIAVAAVVAGSLGAAAALRVAWRGNWIGYVSAAGCLAFVAGVAGQRTFPSQAAVHALGATAAGRSRPGPWDAGVSLPGGAIHITPVALAGLLLAAVGLSLLLLFERVPAAGPAPRRALSPLDEDDTV